MFKKYKQLIIGFVLGVTVFSVIPVGAAIEEFICYKADYKVIVNGSEYINPDLPILNYKGNTYAPFRSMLEKAGLNVDWNAELRQAEVTSNPSSEQKIISKEVTNTMTTQTQTAIDLTQWIGIRDFAKTYPEAYANYIQEVQGTPASIYDNPGSIGIMMTEIGTIRVTCVNYLTYLNVEDLKSAGLMP